jgi:hypothetical protein
MQNAGACVRALVRMKTSNGSHTNRLGRQNCDLGTDQGDMLLMVNLLEGVPLVVAG